MDAKTASHLSDERRADLHRLYREEWWTEGRKRADIERMLDGSDVNVAFREFSTDDLAASSRGLTDGVYKALPLDVIVSADHRGTEFGRNRLDELLAHPALSQVEPSNATAAKRCSPSTSEGDVATTSATSG